MSILFVTDERFLDHVPGRRHPEQPARLKAVWSGLEMAGIKDAMIWKEPYFPSNEDLLRCHISDHLVFLSKLDGEGGGRVDADTVMNAKSWMNVQLAAGAGLAAIDALRKEEADFAFCAIRPPGHHATSSRAMGFCFINNIAAAAANLIEMNERVAIVDIDAHHGNGTQDIFYDDSRVLYLSVHQWPLFPGTGSDEEMGIDAGLGTTINLPLPAGSTGDAYRHAFSKVIIPSIEYFNPDWLLVSAGFDGHRADPLTDLGLTSGDYADFFIKLSGLVSKSRCVFFLEGGYDLDALAVSTGASLAALLGVSYRPESSSNGGPGHDAVNRVATRHGFDL